MPKERQEKAFKTDEGERGTLEILKQRAEMDSRRKDVVGTINPRDNMKSSTILGR